MKISVHGVTLIVNGLDLSASIADGGIVVGPLVLLGPGPSQPWPPRQARVLRFAPRQRRVA